MTIDARQDPIDAAARDLAGAAARYAFAALATHDHRDWSPIIDRLRDVENLIATAVVHAEHAQAHKAAPR